MQLKPAQQARFKLLSRGGPGHGVTGVGHQPKLHVAGSRSGQDHGMSRADAAVFFAVDQQDGDGGALNRIQRTGVEQVDLVSPTRIEQGRGDDGPAKRASEPWLQMQRSGNPLETHFPRRGKRALDRHGTISRLDRQRLQHQCRAVGFAKTVNAL